MTLSTSAGAYSDCYSVMDAALQDDLGVRVKMTNIDAATYFRMRCNMARQIDRKKNLETYEKSHPLHGTSEYDRLVIKLEEEEGEAWVRFERNEIIPGEVQALSTGHLVQMELPIAVPKQLPPPPERAPTDDELAEAFEEIPTVPEEPEVIPPTKIGIRRL